MSVPVRHFRQRHLSPGLSQSIKFIDEDYARGLTGGLREEVADAGCAHADEHLHKFGPADAEERHFCLTCYRLRKKGLTGPGWADQEHPFGYSPPSFWNFSGLFKNSTTSWSSSLASSIPATSAKVTAVSFSAKILALLLPNDMTPVPGPILVMAYRQIKNIRPKGIIQERMLPSNLLS